jgi:hypothetical protein
MHFFDQALEDFRAALDRDGFLERTVMVVLGDHDAGFPRDAALSKTIGIGNDAFSWAATFLACGTIRRCCGRTAIG